MHHGTASAEPKRRKPVVHKATAATRMALRSSGRSEESSEHYEPSEHAEVVESTESAETAESWDDDEEVWEGIRDPTPMVIDD
ncbi:hypothetical protein QCA50_020178 [Cerrena zonata]